LLEPWVLLSPHRLSAAIFLAVLLLPAVPAHSGHPMLSEDTGTQGAGNYELELGYDWSRLEGTRAFLFQPQLSYGTSAALDLIVQPSWLRNTDVSDSRIQGLGDTNLDVKWRFYGAAPLSLGIRAGLELPTAQRALGLPRGQLGEHGILVASFDAAPWAFDLNAGYAYVPLGAGARSSLYHFSGATQFSVNASLSLIAEASADGNPDPAQQACLCVALVGLIYTIHPGFDLDAGYRAPLNAATPAQQWLLGFTFRGAL
jgi:hypothetical protein